MQCYMDIFTSCFDPEVHAYRLLRIGNNSGSREEILELGFGPVICLCTQVVTTFHETSSIS